MRDLGVAQHVRLMHKYAREMVALIDSGELSKETLGRSQLVQAGAVKYLELIGEEAWQLSKLGANLGDNIPLLQIANMRHRMVHAYEGVNWDVVEQAAFEDVPELLTNLGDAAARLGIDLSHSSDPDNACN